MFDPWGILAAAFLAVILQAWMGRRESKTWYLSCIVPLLYGAAVAWMFMGENALRAVQIILFGAAVPITLLLSAWLRRREEDGRDDAPRTDP